MSTYATLDDVAAYGVVVDDPDLAQALLDRCERELDQILRRNTWSWDVSTKLDVTILYPYQQVALANATCAQFEYHIVMGEDFFRLPQPEAVRQPEGGGYDGRLPAIAPKAYRELQDMDLMALTGTLGPDAAWGEDMFAWQRSYMPPMVRVARTYSTTTYRR